MSMEKLAYPLLREIVAHPLLRWVIRIINNLILCIRWVIRKTDCNACLGSL